MTEPPRQRGLDAMRALVVVGLIFFHAALVFDTTDDYYVKNAQTADLGPVAAVGVVWAMPLLFLTAGLGVWYSLGRRTVGAFLVERARRLLVPLVFGVLVLMPLPVWLGLRSQPGYNESYLAFYPRFLHVRLVWSEFPFVVRGAPPDRLFETGQLWFVVLLLTFSLLLLPAFLHLRGVGVGHLATLAERRGVILLPAVPIAVVVAALEMEEPYAAWSRWAYLLFFFLGFVLAADPRFLAAMRRHGPVAAGVGVVVFLGALGLLKASWDAGADAFVDHDPRSMAGRFLFGAAGWLWLVAIVGLLARLPAQSAAPRASRRARAGGYLSDAVLPIYVLHQPVLVAIAFAVVSWPVHPILKYLVITLATLVAVVMAYDLLIRRTRVTRFLFGMRAPRPPVTPAGQPPASPAEPSRTPVRRSA
jgi:surface polysaccharide O-acyltransferase-like enzyme